VLWRTTGDDASLSVTVHKAGHVAKSHELSLRAVRFGDGCEADEVRKRHARVSWRKIVR
jgi:hypothetical protein